MKPIINSRFAPILFGFFISLFMVSFISAFLILINYGLNASFFTIWFSSFIKTWPVSFPTVLIVAPIVRKLVNYLTT